MALSGVHICFGGVALGLVNGPGQPTLPGQQGQSQTMATTALSKIAAPALPGGQQCLLSISASAAIYYSTGPSVTVAGLTENSDGVAAKRYYDPSLGGGREDIFVNAGDLFVWAFA